MWTTDQALTRTLAFFRFSGLSHEVKISFDANLNSNISDDLYLSTRHSQLEKPVTIGVSLTHFANLADFDGIHQGDIQPLGHPPKPYWQPQS